MFLQGWSNGASKALNVMIRQGTSELGFRAAPAFMQQEKSLLHVAATRAKKLLRVSWSGEPSPLIVTPKQG